MRFSLFFYLTVSVAPLLVNGLKEVDCKNEGCYGLIKHFAELLEAKIISSDAILAEAEKELNEITYGNDQSFKVKIKEVDAKLTQLIDEVNTGVDGGEQSLIEFINSVFEDKAKVERLTDQIDNELDNANDNGAKASASLENVKEIIREIQAELNRLINGTMIEGPKALSDAFDRSEKFNSNSNELKDILDQVKQILKDYEDNLRDAKRLTTIAIEKFGEVSKHLNGTIEEQEKVDDMLMATEDMKLSESELENMKKVAKESLEKATKVNEEAFDLLNEVSKYELKSRLDEINAQVEKLKSHTDGTQTKLKDFADENSKFLDQMEKTIEEAEKAEERAVKLAEKLEELLKTIKGIHEDALKAIAEKDEIINDARRILDSLQDFNLSVEKSRESARIAMEKIPEILKKIQDSEKMVEKLEKTLDDKTRIAKEAKEKCSTAKEQMDQVLKETEDITDKIKKLTEDFENMPDQVTKDAKQEIENSNEIDRLEKMVAEDSELIEPIKEKIDKTKSKVPKTDVMVEDAMKRIQDLMDDIAKLKEVDYGQLHDFEKKLKEAEEEMDGSLLDHKLRSLKESRHDQEYSIEQYKLEISELEYQLSVIKMNAESLEKRCFKRTRLEP